MLPANQNQFEFRKKFFKLLGGSFRVLDASGKLLFYSEQKAFKLREDIRVYADESKTNEVLSIKTQQIIDFSPTFEVVDPQSGKVGEIRRKGWKSIVRDQWEIFDAGGNYIGKLEEDSTLLALVRRFLTNLIPQRYDFFIGDNKVGEFRQQFNPFLYRANMDLAADPGNRLDRRLAVAVGILLLAIEGRQN
jgi:uncharacterized protein YxjI